MTNSDNKLILVRSNDNKAQIRYRKIGEPLWSTVYLNETDLDKIIDVILLNVKANVEEIKDG